MFRITDFSILRETQKAIQIQVVSFRTLRCINVWVPLCLCKFDGTALLVSRSFLEEKGILVN